MTVAPVAAAIVAAAAIVEEVPEAREGVAAIAGAVRANGARRLW